MRKLFCFYLYFLIQIYFSNALGQDGQRKISGRIVDNYSTPLSDATILSKSSNHISKSDKMGNFDLNIMKSDSIIEVSLLGFKSQKIILTSSDYYNVVLFNNEEGIDEVVVVGYTVILP